MRIALVTDAWSPQVNGVVRTWQHVTAECERRGHLVEVIAPDQFPTLPCPTYGEIRLAIGPKRAMRRRFDDFRPDALHIATEGPLGFAARAIAEERAWPFTTSYHTKIPEYINARIPVPVAWGYRYMRWFHRPSRAVLVPTENVRQELAAWGFERLRVWTRGVDLDLFRPDRPAAIELPRPVFLYVGRVVVEKNLEDFLAMPIARGAKLIVGDGPDLPRYQADHPEVTFVGAKFGEELAAHYSSADVFVFPSRTDTFGLVMIEALAAGLPVAAYPVTGPADVVGGSSCAVLDEDLAGAAERALAIPRERCRAFASQYTWGQTTDELLACLQPLGEQALATAAAVAAG